MGEKALLQQRDISSAGGIRNEKGINCILLGTNLSWLYSSVCSLRIPSHCLFLTLLLGSNLHPKLVWSSLAVCSWNLSNSISLGEVVKNKAELRKFQKKKKKSWIGGILFYSEVRRRCQKSLLLAAKELERKAATAGFWVWCFCLVAPDLRHISRAVVSPFLQQGTKYHNIWPPFSMASQFPGPLVLFWL